MNHHDLPHHDSAEMALISVMITFVTMLWTSAISGEAIHFMSAIITCAGVFLAQKLFHYLWDRYVTKKKKDDN